MYTVCINGQYVAVAGECGAYALGLPSDPRCRFTLPQLGAFLTRWAGMWEADGVEVLIDCQ